MINDEIIYHRARDKLIVKTSSLVVETMSLVRVKGGFFGGGGGITSARTTASTLCTRIVYIENNILCTYQLDGGGGDRASVNPAAHPFPETFIHNSDVFRNRNGIQRHSDVCIYMRTHNNVRVYLLTSRVVVLFITHYILRENDFGKINAFSLSGLIFCVVAILLYISVYNNIEQRFWTARRML